MSVRDSLSARLYQKLGTFAGDSVLVLRLFGSVPPAVDTLCRYNFQEKYNCVVEVAALWGVRDRYSSIPERNVVRACEYSFSQAEDGLPRAVSEKEFTLALTQLIRVLAAGMPFITWPRGSSPRTAPTPTGLNEDPLLVQHS